MRWGVAKGFWLRAKPLEQAVLKKKTQAKSLIQ
jgi:hypothetical protein